MGYFTAYTDVLSLSSGLWAISAHSSPADGLQGVGIATAAQGQDSCTLAPNSTVTVDGAFTGAIGRTGTYACQRPRGVMLVIHGGAWTVNSVGLVQSMRADSDCWRARGWQTVNLTYRACAESVGEQGFSADDPLVPYQQAADLADAMRAADPAACDPADSRSEECLLNPA